jgi:hypothetical protein
MSMGPSSRSMPGRPNEPFLWGRGGRRRTADDIALERRFAQQQMATGADASPVGHWTQGLARVANGLAGGLRMRGADRQAEELAGTQGQIAAALASGDAMADGSDPVAAALVDPELRQLGLKVMESRLPKQAAPTEFERMLANAGIMPGSPEYVDANRRAAMAKSDPQVTVTLPGGGIFVGPQSELQAVLQGGPQTQAPQSFPPPPQEAVLDLIQNPATAAQFDEVFGPGAAAQVFAARQGFREFTGR